MWDGQCKRNGLVQGSSRWPLSLRRQPSFEDTPYLCPEDSAAVEWEMYCLKKKEHKASKMFFISEKGQKVQHGKEAGFQHLETINSSVPKRWETAFHLFLINLQISPLAHKAHHALIEPSCFMGKVTVKSVDHRYQKETSYQDVIQLLTQCSLALGVVKAKNTLSHKELSIYIRSWGYPKL